MSVSITEQDYGIIILDDDFFLSKEQYPLFVEKMTPILMLSSDKAQIMNAVASIFERMFIGFEMDETKRLSVLSLYQDYITPNSFTGFVVIEWGTDNDQMFDMSALIIRKDSTTIHQIIDDTVSRYCEKKTETSADLEQLLNTIFDAKENNNDSDA